MKLTVELFDERCNVVLKSRELDRCEVIPVLSWRQEISIVRERFKVYLLYVSEMQTNTGSDECQRLHFLGTNSFNHAISQVSVSETQVVKSLPSGKLNGVHGGNGLE